MGITAKLKIVLQAEEVLVAESDDPVLWRRVLATIQGGAGLLDGRDDEGIGEKGSSDGEEEKEDATGKGAVGKFASALGVTTSALQGSCDPTRKEPYLMLDAKAWEAFKKNTPSRGPNAVAGLQLAGTLLCLWFKYSGINQRPTQAQAAAVLDGIGVVDKNPSRAIKNCAWLQSRADGIQINPAEMSKAEQVAKAFVLKVPPTATE